MAKTKDIRANEYAKDYINGTRFLTKNVCVIAFCTKDIIEFGGMEKEIISFDKAWDFAKKHKARFSLFVLEIIRRSKDNAGRSKKDKSVTPKKSK